MDPTPALTNEFWAYMQDRFDTIQVAKKDAVEIVIVATMLDAFKIMKKDVFLNDYTTTLAYPGYATVIYTNFIVGDGNSGRDLWSQMRTCVHEHQHAFQASTGAVMFDERYLLDPAYRAFYESHAYICNCEMEFWRTGQMIDATELGNKLYSYACKKPEVDDAIATLKRLQDIVAQGGIVSESFRYAKLWLDQHPELKIT